LVRDRGTNLLRGFLFSVVVALWGALDVIFSKCIQFAVWFVVALRVFELPLSLSFIVALGAGWLVSFVYGLAFRGMIVDLVRWAEQQAESTTEITDESECQVDDGSDQLSDVGDRASTVETRERDTLCGE
jgi:hypothetical protein